MLLSCFTLSLASLNKYDDVQAKEADYVILGLGIETCGMDPAHNLNPKAHGGKIGTCYQESLTTGYVFPDQYLELEA